MRREGTRVGRRSAFTIIELMIGIGISGILASLALPTFHQYKEKAAFAEVHTHLGAMFRGVKTYYQAEHWAQGTVTTGQADNANHCVPYRGITSNNPNFEKEMLDWDSEHTSFRQIGFTPSEPLRFSYTVGVAVVPGTSTYATGSPGIKIGGWSVGGGCGHTYGGGTESSSTLQLEARGILEHGAAIYSIQWGLCTSPDNELYVCRREMKPSAGACAVSFAKGTSSGASLGVFWLLGFVLIARRRGWSWFAATLRQRL